MTEYGRFHSINLGNQVGEMVYSEHSEDPQDFDVDTNPLQQRNGVARTPSKAPKQQTSRKKTNIRMRSRVLLSLIIGIPCVYFIVIGTMYTGDTFDALAHKYYDVAPLTLHVSAYVRSLHKERMAAEDFILAYSFGNDEAAVREARRIYFLRTVDTDARLADVLQYYRANHEKFVVNEHPFLTEGVNHAELIKLRSQITSRLPIGETMKEYVHMAERALSWVATEHLRSALREDMTALALGALGNAATGGSLALELLAAHTAATDPTGGARQFFQMAGAREIFQASLLSVGVTHNPSSFTLLSSDATNSGQKMMESLLDYEATGLTASRTRVLEARRNQTSLWNDAEQSAGVLAETLTQDPIQLTQGAAASLVVVFSLSFIAFVASIFAVVSEVARKPEAKVAGKELKSFEQSIIRMGRFITAVSTMNLAVVSAARRDQRGVPPEETSLYQSVTTLRDVELYMPPTIHKLPRNIPQALLSPEGLFTELGTYTLDDVVGICIDMGTFHRMSTGAGAKQKAVQHQMMRFLSWVEETAVNYNALYWFGGEKAYVWFGVMAEAQPLATYPAIAMGIVAKGSELMMAGIQVAIATGTVEVGNVGTDSLRTLDICGGVVGELDALVALCEIHDVRVACSETIAMALSDRTAEERDVDVRQLEAFADGLGGAPSVAYEVSKASTTDQKRVDAWNNLFNAYVAGDKDKTVLLAKKFTDTYGDSSSATRLQRVCDERQRFSTYASISTAAITA